MRATSSEAIKIIEQVTERRLRRRALNRPPTCQQLQDAVAAILEHVDRRGYEARNGRGGTEPPFEWTRAVRGLLVEKGTPLDTKTSAGDAAYARKHLQRALTTETTPGLYMVPTIQAGAIIGQIAQFATARAAGARIWPMMNVQKLTVPAAVTSPSFVWMAQTSKQTPTDPNFAQLSFDLAMSQALVLLPAQLFKVAHPSFDVILSDSFALGAAEAEDAAMHASSTVSNGPVALMSQSGITTINAANGNANGGNLLYADLLAVIQKAADLKVRGPLAWFMAGRTLNRCLSLQDGSSRPILVPSERVADSDVLAPYTLLGWPIYLTASISTTESVGSGSNQSHAILAPPRALHIGEGGDVRMDVSFHMSFDSDEVALRVQHQVAFQYQPAASIIVLQGIN